MDTDAGTTAQNAGEYNQTAEDMMNEIALAGGRKDYTMHEEEQETETTEAPTDGNSDENQTPESGQPEEESEQQQQESEKTKENNSESEEDNAENVKSEEEEKAEAEKRRRDLLGLSDLEPDSVESLKDKYENSSREAHSLRDELTSIDEMLKAKGLEIVTTKKGVELKTTDDYKNEISDDEIPNVFTSLTDKEKELAEEDLAEFSKLISKKTALNMLSMRPEAPATQDDVVISETERNSAFHDFAACKLSDGKTPRYPGADDEDVMNTMGDLWKDPSLDSLADWMEKDIKNYNLGLRAIYSMAWTVIAPERARKADAEAQIKVKREKNKKAASVSAGSGIKSDETSDNSSKTIAEIEIDRIANARRK